MLRSLFIASGLFALSACQEATLNAPPVVKEQQSAAGAALGTLQAMAAGEGFSELGFKSAAEAREATLGPELQVFVVDWAGLKDYAPGADPNALLTQSSDHVYPVVIGREVRSSVTLQQTADGFRPAAFGDSGMIRAFQSAQARGRQAPPPQSPKLAPDIPPATLKGAEADFIVRIPPLGLVFVGTRDTGEQLVLTPIADQPEFGLTAGGISYAAPIFERLAPVARAHNGLPT
jgi:hypothetical protein